MFYIWFQKIQRKSLKHYRSFEPDANIHFFSLKKTKIILFDITLCDLSDRKNTDQNSAKYIYIYIYAQVYKHLYACLYYV